MSSARFRPSRAVWGNGLVLLALAVLAAVLFVWQPGDWWHGPPRAQRWIGAACSVIAYVALTGWILWRARAPRATTATQVEANAILVAHASQTGYAIELAMRTSQSLREGGIQVDVRALASLELATLARYRRALFVVSTTGEGDPPDLALGFVRDVMARPATLAPLQYAVLALGDASYAHYCAFGRQLDDWLRRHGATPLFDRVDVDNADDAALRHWQHHLALLAGNADLGDWRPPTYEAWTLRERRLLNPGSLGGPVFHLALTPPAAMPHWQAGDLVEIGPRHAPEQVMQWLQHHALDPNAPVLVEQMPMSLVQVLAARQLPDTLLAGITAQALADTLPVLPHREYSIASLPSDGALQLLVRRMQRPDGSAGLASGWLCDHAAPGTSIALRLRANPNFHPPAPSVPLILIGNGTGIAGLRALFKARMAAGARRNWLLFGERQRVHDFHHGEEITDWQSQGWLERMDLAFSRDGEARIYVQDALRAAAPDLRRWIAEGAAIYVCGSLEGMAPGVDAVLQDVLGETAMETLRLQGRYRRDVY
jgi:sulfite reductase (NADPH) flavoprotein alpha-component